MLSGKVNVAEMPWPIKGSSNSIFKDFKKSLYIFFLFNMKPY